MTRRSAEVRTVACRRPDPASPDGSPADAAVAHSGVRTGTPRLGPATDSARSPSGAVTLIVVTCRSSSDLVSCRDCQLGLPGPPAGPGALLPILVWRRSLAYVAC